MAKLTKTAIKRFQYQGDGKSRDVRWDEEPHGFGVRVYPSGQKAFIVSYRTWGRKRLMTLGAYGTLTLDQARKRARKVLSQVDDGRDPLAEKQRKAEGETFEDLAKKYIEDHAKGPGYPNKPPRKKTWKGDETRLERHIPHGWKGRKVDDIARWEIERLHRQIGAEHPYEANRLLSLLGKMFRLAKVWGFIEPTADNPVVGIERYKEHKRKRWLKPEELPELAEAIDKEPNIYVRAALWLYMLTGARKSEILEAKWDDVNWARGQLRLPETKAGEEQDLSLSKPAVAILQALPRQERNPYILPGAKKGHHLVNIDKPWRRIRTAAGVEDVRLHDLRRTVGSWLSQGGVDLNRIKDALRHSNISTTLIYARLGEDAAKPAMEEHGRRILEAAGKHRPREVVGLDRTK
ncbi:MAG: site-specific integrase [Proteobacteria bacterium]|nr:site-specific integrase [Pseudomonadota bacterium]